MVLDARNPALERAIVDNPEDVDSYLVFADWLIEQGDPRGELVTTQIAGERGGAMERRTAIAVFAKHRDYLFGALGDSLRADALDWKRGFIHHAQIANQFIVVQEGQRSALPIADITGLLLAHPSARFLVKLTIGETDGQPANYYYARTPSTDVGGVLGRIAHHRLGTLRELVVADNHARYSIGPVCAALPRLTELDLSGHYGLEDLALPELRTATFRQSGITGLGLRVLGSAPLPKLVSLTIEFPKNAGVPPLVDDIAALLARVDLPLQHLAISGCQFGNQLIARLAGAPLVAQLSELQITDGTLDDRGARAVAREMRAFRHLELFDLTGNKLTGAGVRLFRQIAPQVIA